MKLISSVSKSEEPDHEFFPKEDTVRAVLQGLCAIGNLDQPKQGYPDYPFLREIDPEDLRQPSNERLKAKGMEWLGLYHHENEESEESAKDSTLFISRCRKAAKDLQVDERHLIDVVLIHEAAHYLTHLGVAPPQYCQLWPGFGDEKKREDVEDFAQSATYFYLQTDPDPLRLYTFEILSLYQPKPYKKWDRWKRQRTKGDSFRQCLGKFQKGILKERTYQPASDPEDLGSMADWQE